MAEELQSLLDKINEEGVRKAEAQRSEIIAAAEAELPELEHKIKVLLLPKDPERKNAEFLGWFTEATGGTQVGCLSLAGETGFSLIGEADSRTD